MVDGVGMLVSSLFFLAVVVVVKTMTRKMMGLHAVWMFILDDVHPTSKGEEQWYLEE